MSAENNTGLVCDRDKHNGMNIRANPHLEHILLALGEVLGQRILRKKLKREPCSVKGKSTAPRVLMDTGNMLSCSTMNSVCGNHAVCLNTLLINNYASTLVVLEILPNSTSKAELNADGKSIFIH